MVIRGWNQCWASARRVEGTRGHGWLKAVPLFCSFSFTLLWASFICCGSVMSSWSTERRLEQVLRNSSAPDPFSSRTPANTVKPNSSRYLDKAWPIPESPPARGQGNTKWAQTTMAGKIIEEKNHCMLFMMVHVLWRE